MAEQEDERKTIISLFAHQDDELGAIGTLANHVAKGDRVIMAWTTSGELTTLFPDEYTIDEVKKERIKHGEEVRKIVGAEKCVFLDLGDGHIENTREQRLAVAKMYVEEKPDAVVSFGMYNNHSDHKNTGIMALEAIKFARVNNIVGLEQNHRNNVVLLSYFERQSAFPVKYIDVSESMEVAKEAANFYADIYKWKNVERWVVDRRRALGIESNAEYAEKFNVRFDFTPPNKYIL